MSRVVADTHALIWFLFDDPRLSEAGRRTLQEAEATGGIAVSSITLVEVVYLVEKNRLDRQVLERLQRILAEEDTALEEIPLDRKLVATMQQVERAEVPDLPDRVIAATALHLECPLVTKDARITSSRISTVWWGLQAAGTESAARGATAGGVRPAGRFPTPRGRACLSPSAVPRSTP